MLTPPLIPLMPSAPSGPFLTSAQLRAGLEACGYHCTTALLSGAHAVVPGCSLVLQFGDTIVADGDGRRCLTVRCSIQINGGNECVRGVTSWRIRRTLPLTVEPEHWCLAIEADLVLAGDIALAAILDHGGHVYHHLHRLVDDADLTLCDLAVDKRPGEKGEAPIVRIEARFFGDLVAGRSGLVAATAGPQGAPPALVAAQHPRLLGAVCDRLKDDVLPALAGAMRRMALQLQAGTRHIEGTPQPGTRALPSSSQHEGANALQTATHVPMVHPAKQGRSA